VGGLTSALHTGEPHAGAWHAAAQHAVTAGAWARARSVVREGWGRSIRRRGTGTWDGRTSTGNAVCLWPTLRPD
jgi:hypothetical protein